MAGRHPDRRAAPCRWKAAARELAAERGHPGRDHVVANLRNGTVRHIINHLALCRICQAVRELGK
jgi:hypothetical protein